MPNCVKIAYYNVRIKENEVKIFVEVFKYNDYINGVNIV
jgi:hypothetical protein